MSLDELRQKIDAIDEKIISLLEKRLNLIKDIKKFKKMIFDPKREALILAKISSKSIQDIYKTIFKNSKEVQKNQ